MPKAVQLQTYQVIYSCKRFPTSRTWANTWLNDKSRPISRRLERIGKVLARNPVRPLRCLALRRLNFQAKLFDHVPAHEPANAVVLPVGRLRDLARVAPRLRCRSSRTIAFLLSGRAASFFAGCGVVFDAFASRFVVAVVAFALPMGWAPRAFFRGGLCFLRYCRRFLSFHCHSPLSSIDRFITQVREEGELKARRNDLCRKNWMIESRTR